MRKSLLTSAMVIAISSFSYVTHAADSATLSVKGKIIPSSCNLAASTESVDFGTIPVSSLTKDANMQVAPSVTLNLSCDASTAVAIQLMDNRSASAETAAELNQSGNITDAALLGLGTDSKNNKIGAFTLQLTGATMDGNSKFTALGSNDKATWSQLHADLERNEYFSLALNSGATSPDPITTASFTMLPVALLKKGDQYPSGEVVNLDGNITFSVVYL
ncbi:DUF1120 domain-containing protein [Enterobacter sp. UPMP2052]